MVVEFYSRGQIFRGQSLGLAEPVPGFRGLAVAVEPSGEIVYVGPRLCRVVEAFTTDSLKF